MIYKIDITDNLPQNNNFNTWNPIKHKFLYDSLFNDIKFKNDTDNLKFIFFSNIKAIATFYETKEDLDKSDLGDYCAYYFESLLSDDDISRTLRNSTTLEINENNCFENKNMKIVFAEKGFVFCKKAQEKEMKDTFERVLFLFLLTQAYNKYSEVLINKVSKSFLDNNYDEMIQIRDDIFSFDVRCFFHNPVKIDRHETFNIWNLIASNYHVKLKYKEMKSQISDLANIIEVKQQKIKETKNQKFERMIAVLGIILAATSLVGFYQDIKDLFFN